jgi:regulator of replication initiation timing
MPPKVTKSPALSDTGLKPLTRGASSVLSQSEDILKAIAALQASQEKLLKLNKQNCEKQLAQFNELKENLGSISSQITELKAENSSLRAELSTLKSKIHELEASSTSSPESSVIQLVREISERDSCSSNVVAYGIPESSAPSLREKIADDVKLISDTLAPLSVSISSDVKLFRIGRNVKNSARPLKIIFKTKVEAASFLSSVGEARRSRVLLPAGVKFVRDKTKLERKLLRESHEELDRRKLNGEEGLSIKYVNGIPEIARLNPKNDNQGRYAPRSQPPVYNSSQENHLSTP